MEGMRGGGFQRYLIQESPHTHDVFHHGGRLAIRLARGRVRFRGAAKGSFSPSWPHDHVAFTGRVNQRGTHTLRLMWLADKGVLRCWWDGRLEGAWVCEVRKPTTTTSLKVGGCSKATVKTWILK